MKKQVSLLAVMLVVAGCSEPEGESKSEQLGKEIAEKIRSPIENARSISEKVQKNRDTGALEYGSR